MQVTQLMRRNNDVLLIMASDGLWDVFSNVDACVMAINRCVGAAVENSGITCCRTSSPPQTAR